MSQIESAGRLRPRQGCPRVVQALVLGLFLFSLNSALAQAPPFGFSDVQALAAKRASVAHQVRALPDNSPLRRLGYDEYRLIQFRPEAALWPDRPFQMQLFVPGFLHTRPVRLNVIQQGAVQHFPFDGGLFQFQNRPLNLSRLNPGGYAGFRVHHPINQPDRFEEFLVFLGASYFRAVGRDQFYGLSARGLAINTATTAPEEFPYFTEFWFAQPEPDADTLTLYALLESASITGAFAFSVHPGETTTVTVNATFYPRVDLPDVGVAPLTSMFMFDGTHRAFFDDYRPAVHDSDGLFIQPAQGQAIWRSLANPARFEVSSFADAAPPKQFGLLQRRQSFAQFNDDEARYDRRPSLWIEPLNDWGDGHVELVEIPTLVEYLDNIVAYWQPTGGFKAGAVYHFDYRMHWGPDTPTSGRIVDVSAGRSVNHDDRVFVIDFAGARQSPELAANSEQVRIHARTSAGQINEVSGTLVAATGHYRAYVRFDEGDAERADLEVFLEVSGQPWGDVWRYRWSR